MTVEPLSIELEEFELVQAAPGTALLRVTAIAPPPTPREPTLLVNDGDHVHRVRPLPSPPDPEGWLRVAYSLRAEVLDRAPTFTLELWPGAFLELPEPLERGRRVLPERAPLPGPGPGPETETDPELEASALEANRAVAALEGETEQLAARARKAESALQDAGEQNERLRAERDELIAKAGQTGETSGPEPAALEAADRAWDGVETSLASLREQIDTDLGRLEEELRAARSEAAAAWKAERAARAEAEKLRAEAAKHDSEQVTELIREAAEDRVRSEVETEIRAALGARTGSR